MIRAVLFDATGTLIELREAVGVVYARIAAEHGVSIPASRIEEAFAQNFSQAPPLVFPNALPDEVPALERAWWRELARGTLRAADATARFRDFDAFFDAAWAIYASSDAWREASGAREALIALRDVGTAIAVVSNFDRRLSPILEGLGLLTLVDAVILPADAGAAKPDPRIFQYALERLAVPAGEAVFIGDDAERDLAGARAAGLRAVDARSLATLAELPTLLSSAGFSPAETEDS